MSSFQDLADIKEDLVDGEEGDRLCIKINNPIQFALAITYYCARCSFRLAARVTESMKERTGLAVIDSRSDYTVAKYRLFACALNMQKLFDLLTSAWTFAITVDISTHLNRLYLNFRIRFHHTDFGIINVHVVAIPFFEMYTGKMVFEDCCQALDVFCPAWKKKIIRIYTDGEKKMTGHNEAVASPFQLLSKPNVICIWCSAQQLNICLQEAYNHFGEDVFYANLVSSAIFVESRA